MSDFLSCPIWAFHELEVDGFDHKCIFTGKLTGKQVPGQKVVVEYMQGDT